MVYTMQSLRTHYGLFLLAEGLQCMDTLQETLLYITMVCLIQKVKYWLIV